MQYILKLVVWTDLDVRLCSVLEVFLLFLIVLLSFPSPFLLVGECFGSVVVCSSGNNVIYVACSRGGIVE